MKPGLSQPRFKIGQYVCNQWYSEAERKTYHDFGWVIGLVWLNHPAGESGWFYFVEFTEPESYSPVGAWGDPVAESELISEIHCRCGELHHVRVVNDQASI